jgi:hypothetical protein
LNDKGSNIFLLENHAYEEQNNKSEEFIKKKRIEEYLLNNNIPNLPPSSIFPVDT